jgi:uncharacterized coiled-coil protein SlyX
MTMTMTTPTPPAPLSDQERLQREAIELREQVANQEDTIRYLQVALDAQELAIDRSASSQARALELRSYRTRRESWTSLSARLGELGEQLARARSGCRRMRLRLKPKLPPTVEAPTVLERSVATSRTLFEAVVEEGVALAAAVVRFYGRAKDGQKGDLAPRGLREGVEEAIGHVVRLAMRGHTCGTDAKMVEAACRSVILPLLEEIPPAAIDQQAADDRFSNGQITPAQYEQMLARTSGWEPYYVYEGETPVVIFQTKEEGMQQQLRVVMGWSESANEYVGMFRGATITMTTELRRAGEATFALWGGDVYGLFVVDRLENP